MLWSHSPNPQQSKLVRENIEFHFGPKSPWQPLKQTTVSLCFPIQRRMAAFQLVFGTIINLSQSDAPRSHSAKIFTLSSTVFTFFCHTHLFLSLQSLIFQDVYYFMFVVFKEVHELTCLSEVYSFSLPLSQLFISKRLKAINMI